MTRLALTTDLCPVSVEGAIQWAASEQPFANEGVHLQYRQERGEDYVSCQALLTDTQELVAHGSHIANVKVAVRYFLAANPR
jgi:hypothetical protein